MVITLVADLAKRGAQLIKRELAPCLSPLEFQMPIVLRHFPARRAYSVMFLGRIRSESDSCC